MDRCLNQLKDAQQMVVEAPEILRGTPVIRGTRIPVHDVASLVDAGTATNEIRELKRVILEGDWTLVTNNSIDFRGQAGKPGSAGEYADGRLHAGLVCIDTPFGLNLNRQRQLSR